MAGAQCPVCKADVPSVDEQFTECRSCGAKLERKEDDAWVLAGEAPAG